MSEHVRNVNDGDFQSEVIEASKALPVMVDFWADWCRPCHLIAPAVEEIAREYAGKLKVVKMNVDQNMGTPSQYNVRGIPTLLLFKSGQVAEEIVGAVPKEHIQKALSRHIS